MHAQRQRALGKNGHQPLLEAERAIVGPLPAQELNQLLPSVVQQSAQFRLSEQSLASLSQQPVHKLRKSSNRQGMVSGTMCLLSTQVKSVIILNR